MKTELLIVFGLVLMACSNQESDDIKTSFNAVEISSAQENLELTSTDIEMTYIDSVLVYIDSAKSSCSNHSITQVFNNELWTYCKDNSGLEFINIDYSKDDLYYCEQYVLRNKMLIYATEWVQTGVEDEATHWNCQYFIRNDEVVDHTSLGHGETETDEWNPESIFEQWNDYHEKYLEIAFIH